MKFVQTICPYCGTGCGLLLAVKDEKVVGVEALTANPVNEGKLCIKGWNVHEFMGHPDRLKASIIRKDGELVEVSWDEALNFTASKLQGIIREHGGNGTGLLSLRKVLQRRKLSAAEIRASPGQPECGPLRTPLT